MRRLAVDRGRWKEFVEAQLTLWGRDRRTLFSNTLSLCSSLNVRDQVSHSYKTTGRIMVLYILTFVFLNNLCVTCFEAEQGSRNQ
jgi:hypothetical protein